MPPVRMMGCLSLPQSAERARLPDTQQARCHERAKKLRLVASQKYRNATEALTRAECLMARFTRDRTGVRATRAQALSTSKYGCTRDTHAIRRGPC